jgi:nitric oxide reductase NorQ protein
MTTPPPPPPASAPAPAPRTMPTGRLGQGELRRQVTAWLAARPGDACTPGEIARALGKSAGATGNALATLADRHEADREPGKPVRYRANAATAGAPAPARPRPAAPSPARPAPVPLQNSSHGV